MKYAHNIEMRVFSKEGDDEERIIEKIKEVFSFDFKKEKIKLNIRTAYGFEDKKIHILTVSIDKERHTGKVIKNIFSFLSSEQKELLLNQMESRLDDNLHFYIRLDKEKLMNNEYWLTDSGNCFHFNIAIAAYPHKREIAKKIIEEMIKSF